jgi:hypothetical protein
MEEENKQLNFDDPEDGGMLPDIPIEEEAGEESAQEDTTIVAGGDGEPEVAGLPLDVIEEAVGYGLTSEEIKVLKSEDNIAAVLSILDRVGEHTSTGSTGAYSGADDSYDDPYADPDENTGADSEVAELRKQLNELKGLVQNKTTETSNTDRLFAVLPEDFDDLFGEVGEDTTKTQSRNRGKILSEMETMKAGYNAKKRRVPSDRRLFKQAVQSVFGDFETKVQRKKFSESVKKRQGQFINRVNSRDSRAPKDGRTSAINSVKTFLAEKGYADFSSTETFD